MMSQARTNYLLLDNFLVAAAAPLTSPRTGTPGPGTLTLTDTGSKLSVSGGRLLAAGMTGSTTDPLALGTTGLARVTGRAVFATIKAPTNGRMRFGWGASNNGVIAVHGFRTEAATFRPLLATGMALDAHAGDTDYQAAAVLRTTGAFLLVKGGALTDWKLAWVDATDTTATLHPGVGIDNQDNTWEADSLRVLDLPGVWANDYGPASQRVAGSVSEGQAFVHAPNAILEWTHTTLPSAATFSLWFRVQDNDNYWRIQITAGGTINLFERIAGVQQSVAATAAGVASGHRVVIVMDGATIRAYSNGVLRWAYTTATNFQTATAGSLALLGTDGAIADLIAWRRDLGPYVSSYL